MPVDVNRFFIARKGHAFGLVVGLIPYALSLLFVFGDLFDGNGNVASIAWTLLTVIWFTSACVAYTKMQKDIDLGRTLPFKLKNFHAANGHIESLLDIEGDIRYITKGELKNDDSKMANMAKKTKWRITLLKTARWLTLVTLLVAMYNAFWDYAYSYAAMTYHWINLLTLLLALVLSFHVPALGFFLVILKSLYLDMEYFVMSFSYQMYPMGVLILIADIAFFIFLFFVVYAEATVPWPICFRKTMKNLKANKKLWRRQKREGIDIPEKRDRLKKSLMLKEAFESDGAGDIENVLPETVQS